MLINIIYVVPIVFGAYFVLLLAYLLIQLYKMWRHCRRLEERLPLAVLGRKACIGIKSANDVDIGTNIRPDPVHYASRRHEEV